MNVNSNLPITFKVLFLVIFITACSSGSDNGTGDGNSNVLEGVSQLLLDGLTTRIKVATANKQGSGFIVATDALINVIGETAITGENSDVAIDLASPISDGDTITVTLYNDTNSNSSFDLGTDLAVESIGGGNIEVVSAITVPSATADVRLRLIANGSASWSVSAEPDTYNWGSISSGTNPTISVTASGVRFEVVNPAVQTHPFGLIDANSGNLGNVKLITQSTNGTPGTGTYFNDVDVNVDESGDTIRFTLTTNLAAETSHYRCDIHTASMLGSFTKIFVL